MYDSLSGLHIELNNLKAKIDRLESEVDELCSSIKILEAKEDHQVISERETLRLDDQRIDRNYLRQRIFQLRDEKLIILKLISRQEEKSSKLTSPVAPPLYHHRSDSQDHTSMTFIPSAVPNSPPFTNSHWDTNESLALIAEYDKLFHGFKGCTRNKDLWAEISSSLVNKGIRRDWKQCKNRWRFLTDKYREDSRHPHSIQTKDKHVCEFFDQLHSMYAKYNAFPSARRINNQAKPGTVLNLGSKRPSSSMS
ncbi:hypothetical protein CONCODRAFT_77408 [Conidiobolus coronatus NRRL 28638]|uniref:Myb-like domain-containing protein n=1 Tax=Conidiobolus coronatus (strain ATCC 28846 / CBS 209.66 / NRRL 28638) TaxID=796925 RepID=A0A137PED3_CONC2|nr:hypothetical protein CONCODRAFT_77408 [Conidiobolus coronatus NRRL 28638]|eukprot:KXN73363.1 hypothetical protein CONCODRAFT_77408 [Conidiobolus coronatus NRRL 28638]